VVETAAPVLEAVGPVLTTVADTATDLVDDVVETAAPVLEAVGPALATVTGLDGEERLAGAILDYATSSTHTATPNEEPPETESKSAIVVEVLSDTVSDGLAATDADGALASGGTITFEQQPDLKPLHDVLVQGGQFTDYGVALTADAPPSNPIQTGDNLASKQGPDADSTSDHALVEDGSKGLAPVAAPVIAELTHSLHEDGVHGLII
jgi:hypothetical protein